MTEKKKKSIFSDEFRRKSYQFGTNVRKDIDGLAMGSLIVITGFTGLVAFWSYIGKVAENLYVVQWIQQYPDVPVTTSFGYHIFQIMDIITPAFLIIVWFFAVIYLFILGYTEPEPEPKTIIKMIKKSKILPADMVCKYCGSMKTRPAGKEHSGKIFCKSCRKYF
jgi:hypothetical protein